MKKKRNMTVVEFVAERQSDPEWVESERVREEEHRTQRERLDASSEPILRSLRAAGYPVDVFDQIVRTYAPLPKGVVDVLLAALTKVDEVRIQEGIVRALGASHIRYDGRVLTELFEATDDHALRWAISNTLSVGKMRGAGAWILDAVQRKEYGTARQMLPLAAVRHNPPELANPILVALLSDMPGHVALGLAESGGESELAALRVQYELVEGWEKNTIGQAIDVIQRRLQERE
jgi:hypothetical protein